MKKCKKITAVFLAVIMLLSVMPIAGIDFFKASALEASGQLSDTVSYTFDDSTGTLTISGTGNMSDYSRNKSPFYDNSSIKTVIIEDGITSIGKNAFYYCEKLISITLPDRVTSIGDCAFEDCNHLISITIPTSVTSIGDSAFYNCYGLTSVTIPDSVTSIEHSAFYNCYQLTDVYYGGTEEEWNAIEIESYNDCLLNANIHFIVPDDGRVYLNDTVYYTFDEASGELTIGGTGDMPDYSFDDSPFQQLGSIKKVTVKGNVTRIGDYAFYQNENITDVTISSELRSIGYEAFLGCTVLENITFPESLTEIGEFAFKSCSSIEAVTIPDSVTSIGLGAFTNCQGIKSINVGAGNSVYDSRNNCNAVIETATNTLVLGCVNTAIPDDITSIGMASFMYCNITNG